MFYYRCSNVNLLLQHLLIVAEAAGLHAAITARVIAVLGASRRDALKRFAGALLLLWVVCSYMYWACTVLLLLMLLLLLLLLLCYCRCRCRCRCCYCCRCYCH